MSLPEPRLPRCGEPTLTRNARGAAAVEFALVAPLLLLLLMGVVAFGGWFWRAHALQQVVNGSARAALGGLTTAERASLARSAASAELASLAELPSNRTSITVSETGDLVSVAVSYDGGGDAFLSLPFVPLPGKAIRQSAAARLGGL